MKICIFLEGSVPFEDHFIILYNSVKPPCKHKSQFILVSGGQIWKTWDSNRFCYPNPSLPLIYLVEFVNEIYLSESSPQVPEDLEFFKRFSEYIFCITLIADCFLKNKICKFYHIQQARYSHSKGFQKSPLNIL